MEWLNNVTNQMDSFGLMANDIGLDSCHLEAVDESHNENRDWSGAIKDWHLASEAEMPPKMPPRPLHSVRIWIFFISNIKFFINLDYFGPLRVLSHAGHQEGWLSLNFGIWIYFFILKFWSNIYMYSISRSPSLSDWSKILPASILSPCHWLSNDICWKSNACLTHVNLLKHVMLPWRFFSLDNIFFVTYESSYILRRQQKFETIFHFFDFT